MEIFSSLHLTGRRIAILVLGCLAAVVVAVGFVSMKDDVYEENSVVFLGQFLGEDVAENTFAVEQQAADFEVALQLPEVLEQTAAVAGISPDEVGAGMESVRESGTSVVVAFEHGNPEVARDVVTSAPRFALSTLADQQLSVAQAKEQAELEAMQEAEQALLEFRQTNATFDVEQEVISRKEEIREIQRSRAQAFGADADVRPGLIAELDALLASREAEYQRLFALVPEYQTLVNDLADARERYDESKNSRARAEARFAAASESAVIVDDVTSVVPRTSEYVRAALSAVIAVIAIGLLGFSLIEVASSRRRGTVRPATAAAAPGAAAAEPAPAPAVTVTVEPAPAAAAEVGDELVETAARVAAVDPLIRTEKSDNGAPARRSTTTNPRPRRRTPTSTPK